MAAKRSETRTFRVEVLVREDLSDARGNAAWSELRQAGIDGIEALRSVRGYALSLPDGADAARRIAAGVLADPVSETWVLHDTPAAGDRAAADHRIDVVKKPGVMDPAADGVLRAIQAAGEQVDGVHTYQAFLIRGTVAAEPLRKAAARVLGNEAIELIRVDQQLEVDPLIHSGEAAFERVEVPLPDDDAALLEVSTAGGLSLSLLEMAAIREHFRAQGRPPTDVELETLAQTWSEHCKHKTLAGAIRLEDRTYGNMLKETIFEATRRLDLPWCKSVFVDNAGVVGFDDDFHVTFKVETHNHPSAIEPYGGAGTGIGGVIRDTMGTGLGARPIVSTDVFCFGLPDSAVDEVPTGALHPLRVLKGVVAGVRDYGNRMGIPTANGALVFDQRFTGNPLVFCGSVGLLPAGKVEKAARPGDRVVVVGGRTGRDGIHGATFSSRELHSESESVDSGAVQIGNAITEKRVLDALLQARDRQLFSCVTDCGAGGLSSAVGEMAEECGAEVDLEKVPLKYAGLSYAEIWISEAQERMVLAVPPEQCEELLELFRREDVEATVIGEFTDRGRLLLRYRGQTVGDLDIDFLFNGIPGVERPAAIPKCTEDEPVIPCPDDLGAALHRLLRHPDITSKEWVVRQYDHEVQAGMVVKPFVGWRQGSPGDAAVVRPRLDSDRGIAVGCGIQPRYGDIDPYAMALACIDEAVRNVIAVGGRADRVALLDNFCAGNCERPEILGSVVRIAEGCRDAALALGAPFISGKDSLNNEYRTDEGSAAIPTTLLVSSLTLVDDVKKAVTSDLKQEGNCLVLIGETRAELGGSCWYSLHDRIGRSVPRVDLERSAALFQAVSAMTSRGLLKSCHDLADGGLAVAAAEMMFGSPLGLEIDLSAVPRAAGAAAGVSVERDDVLLFSESPTRFLAEVEEASLEQVRQQLSGLPHAVIGRVSGEPRLLVRGCGQEIVLDQPVDGLLESFRAGLDLGSPAAPPGHATSGRSGR